MPVNIKINIPKKVIEYDRKATKQALKDAARIVLNKAKASLQNTGSGRKYGQHTASAPGQPPSSDTAALAKGMRVKSGRGLSIDIIDPYYSRFLELGAVGGGGAKGTRNKRRRGKIIPATMRVLEARPFMEPAAEAEMPDLQERIAKAVMQGVRLKDVK